MNAKLGIPAALLFAQVWTQVLYPAPLQEFPQQFIEPNLLSQYNMQAHFFGYTYQQIFLKIIYYDRWDNGRYIKQI